MESFEAESFISLKPSPMIQYRTLKHKVTLHVLKYNFLCELLNYSFSLHVISLGLEKKDSKNSW